jgi:hypothetical protein
MQTSRGKHNEFKDETATTTVVVVPQPHLYRSSTSSASTDESCSSISSRRSYSGSSTESGSGSKSAGGRNAPVTHPMQRKAYSLEHIITTPPPQTRTLPTFHIPRETHSPEHHSGESVASSPDVDADPLAEAELRRLKPPFINFPNIQKILDGINTNPPPANNFQMIAQAKIDQIANLEVHIRGFTIQELQFLSLFMHSVQEGNSTNNCFKTIRTECGAMGWFQVYGNTRSWQHLRSFVKDCMDNLIRKSELPSIKKPLHTDMFQSFLQVFQQHSGRWWAAFGKTRSEKNFLNNFCPIPGPPTDTKSTITISQR